MLQIVQCKTCSKELSWGLKGHTSYTIEIDEYSPSCMECGHSRGNEKVYSFCSLKCMKEYVNGMEKK